jgi:hypothetical protein
MKKTNTMKGKKSFHKVMSVANSFFATPLQRSISQTTTGRPTVSTPNQKQKDKAVILLDWLNAQDAPRGSAIETIRTMWRRVMRQYTSAESDVERMKESQFVMIQYFGRDKRVFEVIRDSFRRRRIYDAVTQKNGTTVRRLTPLGRDANDAIKRIAALVGLEPKGQFENRVPVNTTVRWNFAANVERERSKLETRRRREMDAFMTKAKAVLDRVANATVETWNGHAKAANRNRAVDEVVRSMNIQKAWLDEYGEMINFESVPMGFRKLREQYRKLVKSVRGRHKDSIQNLGMVVDFPNTLAELHNRHVAAREDETALVDRAMDVANRFDHVVGRGEMPRWDVPVPSEKNLPLRDLVEWITTRVNNRVASYETNTNRQAARQRIANRARQAANNKTNKTKAPNANTKKPTPKTANGKAAPPPAPPMSGLASGASTSTAPMPSGNTKPKAPPPVPPPMPGTATPKAPPPIPPPMPGTATPKAPPSSTRSNGASSNISSVINSLVGPNSPSSTASRQFNTFLNTATMAQLLDLRDRLERRRRRRSRRVSVRRRVTIGSRRSRAQRAADRVRRERNDARRRVMDQRLRDLLTKVAKAIAFAQQRSAKTKTNKTKTKTTTTKKRNTLNRVGWNTRPAAAIAKNVVPSLPKGQGGRTVIVDTGDMSMPQTYGSIPSRLAPRRQNGFSYAPPLPRAQGTSRTGAYAGGLGTLGLVGGVAAAAAAKARRRSRPASSTARSSASSVGSRVSNRPFRIDLQNYASNTNNTASSRRR